MNISQGQKTTLTAIPVDVNTQPVALLPGDVPSWSDSLPDAVDLVPSADGLSLDVSVHPDAPLGDITFEITDGLPPSASSTFILTVTPAVVPNPVAGFNISASTPV